MQPETNGIQTWQWVVTVIVIIVLIVVGVMVFGHKSSAPTTTDTGLTGSTDTGTMLGANGIVMSDQYPGNVAYLSSVQVEKAGWVVIHKDNSGQPGAIIGSAWVAAGISPVKVTLTQAMVDGGTYYAMLHSDDGDQVFDATKDMPLKDANGSVIMHIFHASAAAAANLKG